MGRPAGVIARAPRVLPGARLHDDLPVEMVELHRQVLPVERMVEYLRDANPMLRVDLEHRSEEVLALGAQGNVIRERVVCGQYLLYRFPKVARVRGVLERVAAAQEHEQSHAAAPDVGLPAVVRLLPRENLGCDVRWSPDRRFGLRVQMAALAVPEVADFDNWCAAAGGIEEDVFELQIPVDDAHAVAVGDAADELLEIETSFVFVESAGLGNPVEELAAARVLHHNCQMCGRQPHLLKRYDVRVPKLLMHLRIRRRAMCVGRKPTTFCQKTRCHARVGRGAVSQSTRRLRQTVTEENTDELTLGSNSILTTTSLITLLSMCFSPRGMNFIATWCPVPLCTNCACEQCSGPTAAVRR